MAKAKMTAFFCKECGYESAKWMGQCPACREWNTMVEEPVAKKESGGRKSAGSVMHTAAKPMRLDEVSIEDHDRIPTGFKELDRVLGSGIVAGSGRKVLYISGEESLKQIKLRANRIGTMTGDISFLCETNLDDIEEAIREAKPEIVIIDSIQTMYREDVSSAPGSVSQVRESTNILMQIAKGMGISVFIVGHVTKEGVVAGPRVLEHMVDTVLYFEGDRNDSYRILRGVKNRFGSTNEIGVFEMQEQGLVEVENPSEYLLSGRPEEASGAVVACSIEGTRPILLEVQALVAQTNFGMPRRTAAGTDYNRVNLLMAVLEKRCHYEMSRYDAYVNITGGIRMNEPALDLAIIMALVSSLKDKPVNPKCIIFGEVGLSGEVRAVSMAEQRVNEAIKLGFEYCILPKVNLVKLKKTDGIVLYGVSNVKEAIQLL
jgi:DNA repair protein RadA/Sms